MPHMFKQAGNHHRKPQIFGFQGLEHGNQAFLVFEYPMDDSPILNVGRHFVSSPLVIFISQPGITDLDGIVFQRQVVFAAREPME